MFCRRCYADMTGSLNYRCTSCGRRSDRTRPRSMLTRPFPDARKIAWQVTGTTALGCAAACFVAVFQLVRTSGH